eukprot:CAMPEP_0198491446 /NCGR_PEP_ID=MMETSP1462-20131121/2787_1 /TAXON_ID=1333877 /ORGANISM="Brandtodinium nutriculum, Strain RCC3387" /LENGTH=194 /DNA_ID=CAMNT_0044220051 /DNA_START=204 /DNA_END=785 /DNA_ORIENTATION=+
MWVCVAPRRVACSLPPPSNHEEAQRQRHHGHAHHDAARDEPVGGVVLVSGGQKLQDDNHDHHARDQPEQDAVDALIHVVPAAFDDGPSDKSADWLGKAGKQSPQEASQARVGRIIDWQRHAQALRDVMDTDGNGQGDADRRVRQGADERREALGEVVDRDGDRRVDAHRLELLLVPLGAAACGRGVLWACDLGG